MNFIKVLLALLFIAVLGVFGFAYSGLYPIGADVPHNGFTNWYLETLRERSIAKASADIVVPSLDDSDLLLRGGPDYNDMCAGCHLKPGRSDSDLSIGLYPTPPNLSSTNHGHGENESHTDADNNIEQVARRQFWIIKHGIKVTGMPAWGPTHDDERIWAMVAFLQKLPELNEVQYQILTTRSGDSSHTH